MQNLKQTLSIFSWVSTRQLEKRNHLLIFRDHLKHFSKKNQKKKKKYQAGNRQVAKGHKQMLIFLTIYSYQGLLLLIIFFLVYLITILWVQLESKG